MSCQKRWAEYNAQLEYVTNLPPGSADAAPRCVQCQRPLLKDGRCVIGHSQGDQATTPAWETTMFEMDALRCLLGEVIAKGRSIPRGRSRPYLRTNHPDLLEANQLLAQLDRPEPGSDAETVFLRLADLLQPLAYESYREHYGAADVVLTDPRFRAVRVAAVRMRLARATRQLNSAPPGADQALAAAWGDAERAYFLASNVAVVFRNQTKTLAPEGAQARAILQHILPAVTEDQGDSAQGWWTWCSYWHDNVRKILGQATSGMNFGLETGWETTLGQQGGVWILPAQIGWQTQKRPSGQAGGPYGFPNVFSPEAQSALGALGLQPEATRCFLPLRDLRRLFQDSLAVVQQDLGVLGPLQAQLQAAPPGQVVETARTVAIPLFQEAVRREQDNSRLLRDMGGAGQDIIQQLTAAKTAAMDFLRGLKPVQLAQALAGMGYERRVIDLLRFPGVREALLDPANQIDVFQELPQLAAATVIAKRACDLLPLDQWRSIYQAAVAPPSPRLLPTLRQARELVCRARAQLSTDKEGAGFALSVVQKMVAGLPPTTAPSPTMPPEQDPLQLVRDALHHSWTAVNLPREMTMAQVRSLAGKVGVPYSQYATSRSLVRQWLESETPAQVQRGTREILRGLTRTWISQITAPDHTGHVHTYRGGQTIEVMAAEGPQERAIYLCRFVAENPDAEGFCDTVQPSVEVFVPDGKKALVPITQIRPAKKKKGTP